MWRRVLGLIVAALQVVNVACHGYMAEPAARNVQHWSNNCPHCLPAGGPGTTFMNGRKFPDSLHGVCGDKWNEPKDHEAGGKFATPPKIAATYAAGQTIAIHIEMTAVHAGRYRFGICPVPPGASPEAERAAVTQKCFDANPLINAEDGTPFWWVGKKGIGTHSMTFKLPPNIVCDRCVLQWHYESGNSCTHKGTPEIHAMGDRTPCVGSTSIEEFWNCADVKVTKGGKPSPLAKAPKTKINNPVDTKAYRDAKKAQANELRKTLKGLPPGIKEQVQAQVKNLDALARGEPGEGFADYGRWAMDAARPLVRPEWQTLLSALAIVATAGFTLPAAAAIAITAAVLVLALYPSAARERFARAWPLLPARRPWYSTGHAARHGGAVHRVGLYEPPDEDDLEARFMALRMPSVPVTAVRRPQACAGEFC